MDAPEAAGEVAGAGAVEPRERILAAARQIFLDGPPELATMDAVAQAAGMSKKTIYRTFKSQFELLTALLAEVAADFPESPAPTQNSDLEAELAAMLTRLATYVTSSRSAALFRLIISEVRRYPELIIHRPKNPYPVQIIARWLSAEAVTRRHDLGEPMEAAAMLLGMVMQDAGLKILLPAVAAAEPLTPAEIERRARFAARVFLKGLERK
jgi:AcrR family transcriptional regulator